MPRDTKTRAWGVGILALTALAGYMIVPCRKAPIRGDTPTAAALNPVAFDSPPVEAAGGGLSHFEETVQAPSGSAPSRDRVREEIQRASSEPVREAGKAFLEEQERYDQMVMAYRATHHQYAEAIARNASQEELRRDQKQLDDRIQEIQRTSQSLYRLSTVLKDAYAEEKLATLPRRTFP